MSDSLPRWYTPVSILALIWNILGLLAFTAQVMITDEMIAAMPAPENMLYANIPLWATIAFGVATIGGTLGALMLVMKKSLALPLLIVSLVGVLVQDYHSFLVINVIDVYGYTSLIMPAIVLVIGVMLILLARKGQANGWLN